jgi:hypothetical protein
VCVRVFRHQVDGILQFETDAGEVLAGWDEQIEAACKGVNAILEDLEKNPNFSE